MSKTWRDKIFNKAPYNSRCVTPDDDDHFILNELQSLADYPSVPSTQRQQPPNGGDDDEESVVEPNYYDIDPYQPLDREVYEDPPSIKQRVDNIDSNFLSDRHETKFYSCLKTVYAFFQEVYARSARAANCIGLCKHSCLYAERERSFFMSSVKRFKYVILLALLYTILSALQGVIQIRIYKQMLVYSFVHEIIVVTFLQCTLILLAMTVWFILKKLYEGARIICDPSRYTRKSQFDIDMNNLPQEEEEEEEEGLEFENEDEYDFENTFQSKVSTVYGRRFIKAMKPDYCTRSNVRFYVASSFLHILVGVLRVAPIMVLPPILIILMKQVGLIFMVVVSYLYLKQRYDKIQLLCILLIAVGILQDILPDYDESVKHSQSISHDFFWRNTIYHNFDETPINHMHHYIENVMFSPPSSSSSSLSYNMSLPPEVDTFVKNGQSFLFRGHFLNGTVFDLSRCLSTYNITVEADETLSFTKYQAALNHYNLDWWMAHNVSFVICVLVAMVATLPECFHYAMMEKFWKIPRRHLRGHTFATSRSGEAHTIQATTTTKKAALLRWLFGAYLSTKCFGVSADYKALDYDEFYDYRGVDADKEIINDDPIETFTADGETKEKRSIGKRTIDNMDDKNNEQEDIILYEGATDTLSSSTQRRPSSSGREQQDFTSSFTYNQGLWAQVRAQDAYVSSVRVAINVILYKVMWALICLPFFFIVSEDLGGHNFLKNGVLCSFDALYYTVAGIFHQGSSSEFDITSIHLEEKDMGPLYNNLTRFGEMVTQHIDLSPFGFSTPSDGAINLNGNDSLVQERAYMECSPWRNGLDCQHMLVLTFVICIIDILQYILYVKICRDTVSANLVWFLGIIRLGLANIILSLPTIAGAVFTEFRFFDIMSLAVITCGALIFWFHHINNTKTKWHKEMSAVQNALSSSPPSGGHTTRKSPDAGHIN